MVLEDNRGVKLDIEESTCVYLKGSFEESTGLYLMGDMIDYTKTGDIHEFIRIRPID